MRVGIRKSVRGAGGERGVVHAQWPEQAVLKDPGQRLSVFALLGDEAEQRVVGVVVVKGRTGREVRRVLERDGQHLVRGPDLGRVSVEACRDLGRIGVVVEAAAHLQQVGDGDLVAVGRARNVFRDRIVEIEPAFLGQLSITAAVIVLVFEAIRKWVSARGGIVAPSVVVP